MLGRAMLFKTIARETSEVRGGFVAVPGGLNVAQGVALLNVTDAGYTPARPASGTLKAAEAKSVPFEALPNVLNSYR
jgi:hypothetical protein